MTKVDEVWNKMNKSERFGCQFALFPAWVQDYGLTKEEIVELIRRPNPNINEEKGVHNGPKENAR